MDKNIVLSKDECDFLLLLLLRESDSLLRELKYWDDELIRRPFEMCNSLISKIHCD